MDEARTVWVGNITDEVTEELLYEIFLQAGPLERVTVRSHQGGTGFGFVTFKHEESVPYVVELFQDLKLFGVNVNIKPRTGGNRQNSMRRSGGYPNLPQSNEHTRFEQSADFGDQMALEELVRPLRKPIMKVGNSNHSESYDQHGSYNDSFNGRNRYDEGDRERPHRDFYRPAQAKNRNHPRPHHKRDNYNRNRGRRHQPY